jgi:hypothetical protein
MHDARNALSISASYNMQGARSVKKITGKPQKNATMCVGYMSIKCVSTKLDKDVSKRENREVKVCRDIQLAVVWLKNKLGKRKKATAV